jgi:hypothetical protein
MYNIHGDRLPIQNICTTYMGTDCQYKIYVQHIWGQIANAKECMHRISLITMHAMQAGVHSTLGSSQGNLLLNRDMFLNIHLIADWHTITQRREHLIHENLMRKNQKRRGYDYATQQLVLKKNGSLKNWAKEQVVHTK